LTWTFHLLPHGNLKTIITPLSRTTLFYNSTMKSLLSIIAEKDAHIKALQEKLQDLGGCYFPRKHKHTLESFEEEKWRDEQRKLVARGKESGWEVFERWREMGEDEVCDWEAVVEGLGSWTRDEQVLTHILKILIVAE
jgi:hypothetical protein